ncbi:MAG: hypothetical protein ABIP27_09345 [Flavobacterium circumlabens]|uniref:hypothetical protein n=1 Tax=Flavobacterium circumlabens TaxID=2133765 RepID=UPI003264281D
MDEKSEVESMNLSLEQLKRMVSDRKGEVNNYDKLTIEELRNCKGFETVSDSEGCEIIESLFQLAIIVCNY